MPPTIRTTFDMPRRAGILSCKCVDRPADDRGTVPGMDSPPSEKAIHRLRALALEVEPPRMADGFEADRMRLLAAELRRCAAALPTPDQVRLLARLEGDAQAAGLAPEAYLEQLGAIDRAIGGLARIGLRPTGDELHAALEAISRR